MTGTATEPLVAGDPAVVGPYRLLARLRAGPTGVVYLGRAGGGAPVDVRILQAAERGTAGFTERLEAQVDAVGRVARFGLAPVVDADLGASPPYLVSEHVDGPSLEAVVAERGPLDPGSLEGLAIGVARALAAMHAAGTVHGDLRPGVVLLSDVGVRVVDFGIAPVLELTVGLTAMAPPAGDAAFVAPEQHLGGPMPRSGVGGAAGPGGWLPTAAADVYAWGALLAFAAGGRQPFGTGSGATVAYRAVHGAPDLSALPRGLRELAAAAMAPDPSARPTASGLLERLTGGPASLPPTGGAGRPPLARGRRGGRRAGRTPAEARRARRRARLTAAVAAAALAAGAATAGVTWLVASPPEAVIRAWNPPPGVAPNPVVADDFSRRRDWEELRPDERTGTRVGYERGGLRAVTRDVSVLALGPKQAIGRAAASADSDGLADIDTAHLAVDAAWAGGGRAGAVVLACGLGYGVAFGPDGTTVAFGPGAGADGVELGRASARVADLAAPRRLEASCETLAGGRSVRLVAWVNGAMVVEAAGESDREVRSFRPEVGVTAGDGPQVDVLLDNFAAWIDL